MSNVTLLCGDALGMLKTLPDGIADTCVTSPSYFGLRSYLDAAHQDKALEIGTEQTPQAFVSRLVAVFREVRRVLKDDGVLWCNIGDHDPSGIDMTRDVRERLELFSESCVNVHRVALNMDQIEEYSPPENPAKMTDSCATDYVRRFGNSSWELDALEPSLLAQIVTAMVEELRDFDLYEAARSKQDAWKAELQEAADKYRAGS